MKNETTLPVYDTLEALLAAEAPSLRDRCLALADEMAQEINGNLFYVPDEDIESCLADLTEANPQGRSPTRHHQGARRTEFGP